jgi:hypothetical protein
MLIVGTVGMIVLTILVDVWRWYAHSTAEQQVSVSLCQELKLAAEAMAQDYGPAIASRSLDGASIQIDLDGGGKDGLADWASPDTIIEYSIVDGKLVRRDVLSGADGVVIASNLQTLEATTQNGKLEVKLTAKVRKTEQSITLRLAGT